MSLPRCLCGHGPSRHYHVAGADTSCRICTTCYQMRPRCQHTVYHKRWPEQCTRRATVGNLCRQHAEAGR